MIEINEADYKKLIKDANDNRSIFKIIILIIVGIILTFSIVSFSGTFANIIFKQYEANVQMQIALDEAENDVRIRKIESEGLTTEEYLKWLEVRKEN